MAQATVEYQPLMSVSFFQRRLSKAITCSFIPWWLLITSLTVISLPSHADNTQDKVNRVKAAFVYNIAKFVAWPDAILQQRPDQLQICLYQQNFLAEGLQSVIGRVIHGRKLTQKIIPNLRQVHDCDILLLSANSMASYLQEHVEKNHAVLTIADLTAETTQGKVYQGIVLNLIRRGSSIGFEVNLKQVEQRQLEVSSRLLKLARILEEGS